MIRTSIAAFLVSASLVPPFTDAAPGQHVPSFGVNGVAELNVLHSDDYVQSLVLRSDGKLVAIGRTGDDLALARYLPSGALDPAFGSNGTTRFRMPDVGVYPIDALEQPDGRIVVLATCGKWHLGYRPPCVIRFEADGAHDPSFQSDAAAAQKKISAGAIALQADGKVVMGLSLDNGFGAARLSSSGALDTTFGAGGFALAEALYFGETFGAAVQSDGRIVIARAGPLTSATSGWQAARFNADGSVDASFSRAGIPGAAGALALQPDGRVLVAGTSQPNPNDFSGNTVWRLRGDGTPDPAFGSGGAAFVPGARQIVRTMKLYPDGRIAVGTATANRSGGSELIRLTANGSPDPTFGTGGVVVYSTYELWHNVRDLVVQPDGRIVAGASLWERDFALTRYTESGAPDSSFGTGGTVTTGFFNNSSASQVELLGVRRAGGKLIAVVAANHDGMSSSLTPALPSMAVAKVLPDGTMDPTFGNGRGWVQHFEFPKAFEVMPDESVVFVDNRFEDPNLVSNVKRMRSDGTMDPAFGSGGHTRVDGVYLSAIERMPDGRLVLSGHNVLVRLMPNGAFDPSFGSGGIARHNLDTSEWFRPKKALSLQPDGKILVGHAQPQYWAARFLPDGTPDPTFGSAGVTRFGDTAYELAGLVVHGDGRVTLAGKGSGFIGAGNPGSAFVRMDANGGAGATVTGAGYLAGRLGETRAAVSGIRLDANDRLVAAGSRHAGNGQQGYNSYSIRNPIVMRFTPSGALDLAFGEGGIAKLHPDSSWYGQAITALPEADGSIVAGSVTSTGFAFRVELHRLEGGGASTPNGPPNDVDADGFANATEMLQGRDPFVNDNAAVEERRQFAMQQYRDFLGREGDAAGVDHWTQQLNSEVVSPAKLVETFFTSPEFQGTGAPMARLYFAYFLRIPDYGGLDYWIGQFRAGNPLQGISNQFAASPEFVNTYGALDNAGFVDRVYRNALGRAPDAGGLAHWKGQLDGGMTRGRLMVEFSESAEYRGLIANEVFVTMVYAGMLRRAPDAGGFSFWVSYLDAGNTGIEMITGILGGAEYRARFLP